MLELDVRGLPPPVPFENVMNALRTLPIEETLQVHIHREPYPLYDVLRDNGYVWQTFALVDGSFKILINRTA